MLRYNTTLTHLSLDDNSSISDEGVTAIAKALQENNSNSALVHLSMKECGIGAAGAMALADMLRHNSTLDRDSLLDGLDGVAKVAVELCTKTSCSVSPDL